MPSKEYARPELLAETDWLADHLTDPTLRIVDIRGSVRLSEAVSGVQEATYSGAAEDYAQGHIPGAIYLDWTQDIIDLADQVPVQVAGAAQLAERLGQAGIGNEHTVVIYDSHPASQFATRLWWVLGYYGHDRVKILNGGFGRWQKEGRPLSQEPADYPPTVFEPHLRPDWRITADELQASLAQPDFKLIDARDERQYRAEVRRGERGGRIPGAINLPRELLIDPLTGRFQSADQLEDVAASLGLTPDQPVVAYCNGGVAATSVLFALRLLGYNRLTNYDGSWNEWSNRPDLPIEV